MNKAALAIIITLGLCAQLASAGQHGEGRQQGRMTRQSPHCGMGRGGDGCPMIPGAERMARALRNPETAEKIGLSEEQHEQIKAIWREHKKAAIDMEAEMESARKTLGNLLEADITDREAIDEAIQTVSSARATMMRASIHAGLDVKALLTPAQIETLKAMREEFRSDGNSRRRSDRERKHGKGKDKAPEA